MFLSQNLPAQIVALKARLFKLEAENAQQHVAKQSNVVQARVLPADAKVVPLQKTAAAKPAAKAALSLPPNPLAAELHPAAKTTAAHESTAKMSQTADSLSQRVQALKAQVFNPF